MSFSHLHVRSGFSFLFGTFTPETLIKRAKEMSLSAVALTDKNGLYGAIRFYLSSGMIKPIIGTEIDLSDRSSIVLLAKDFSGYKNLCHIITEGRLSGERKRPNFSIELLSKYPKSLICLSGGRDGRVWKLVKEGKTKEAKRFCLILKEIFKENFFIEIQNHNIKGDIEIVEKLIDISKRLKIKAVATNSVTFLKRGDYKVHKALIGIQNVIHHRAVSPVPCDEFYLKDRSEMERAIPFIEAIQNANEIASEIHLHIPIGRLHPPGIISDGFKRLSRLCYSLLPRRYRNLDIKVARQLDKEFSFIREKGLSEYFLIAYDIFNFAREKGIRCSLRGSACGSIVSYLLFGGVEPIENELLFERFLNESRFDPPDIDIDFDSERRDEVVEYVFKKYSGKAALLSNFSTFRARSAIREVLRALGYSYSKIDELSSFIPYHILPSQIDEAIERLPELKGNRLKEKKEAVDIISRLDGLPRHLSTHLGGVVISNELFDLCPMEISAKGLPVIQYDKDDIEALGITKFDLLGLRMHTAISNTINYLKQRGINIDIDSIPLDDKKTYSLLRSTDTVGVFQLESPGQRQLLGRLQPNRFQDIIAEISLFRPGPMQANMISPYLKRRHKKEKVTYIHKKLIPILKETYGVIMFQEQVLRVVNALSGFPYDRADAFRRAMTKDRGKEEMESLKEEFIDGCVKNGVDRRIAEVAFKKVSAFAAYGFCKAHAASFAKIAYQSAYLKANYPLEFYVGLLNAGQVGSYPKRVILNEAKRRFNILPPHVNFSEYGYSIEENCIRVGLSAIKGIGIRTAKRIIEERKRDLFKSIDDFKVRINPAKDILSSLINCGALTFYKEAFCG